jgi:hypothetical protein
MLCNLGVTQGGATHQHTAIHVGAHPLGQAHSRNTCTLSRSLSRLISG